MIALPDMKGPGRLDEENVLHCPECDGGLIWPNPAAPDPYRWEMRTLMGYGYNDPDHHHDDNCKTRCYYCPACEKYLTVAIRRSCPNCDWKGKPSCSCHSGPKYDQWPKENP